MSCEGKGKLKNHYPKRLFCDNRKKKAKVQRVNY